MSYQPTIPELLGKRKWAPNYGNNLGPDAKRSRPSVPGAPMKGVRPLILRQPMQPVQSVQRNNKRVPNAPKKTHTHKQHYNPRTVGNTRKGLERNFNIANLERIAKQFQRGNVENPKIPLETNNNWDNYVNSLVNELGAVRINTNYTNNNNNGEQPPAPLAPLERQTYAHGGKRKRQTRRKTRRRN